MPKQLVICDDHTLFLSGITQLLQKLGNNYEITAFSDSKNCQTYIQQHIIDVFICDLNIDNADGFELISNLKPYLKNTKIIVLSAYLEDFLIQKAQKMGAHAFLKKETTALELINVIEADLNTPFYTNKINKNINPSFAQLDNNTANKFKLTQQEKQIIKLICQGQTSQQAAQQLNISKTTVDTHRKNINRKLNITSTSTLIKFANENNLFS
ncbi:MAG: DNA-binding response regulator [Sphingobacteriales bacterium]|jgi:DNA-binding NarL/FixJ family response regulator|nr:MAG: DNA-binding response regulator [Sphingobacteriales bacterium]TAF78754.1 MAG: DNA-binding response regulator [Sphingobacteriales bacterium]